MSQRAIKTSLETNGQLLVRDNVIVENRTGILEYGYTGCHKTG